MFFKSLRPRSKSSKSTKPSIDRVSSTSTTKTTTTHPSSKSPKTSSATVSSSAVEEGEEGEGEGELEGKDYQEFLEKAKKEAERKDKELLRSIMKARETNLSPWAGRM